MLGLSLNLRIFGGLHQYVIAGRARHRVLSQARDVGLGEMDDAGV
jgi:hypothetical protein